VFERRHAPVSRSAKRVQAGAELALLLFWKGTAILIQTNGCGILNWAEKLL